MAKQKKNDVEWTQWCELYEYVKKEILQYDENQKIHQSLVLRLKGLASGKFIENNNISSSAKYDYNIILRTFQVCKPTILTATKNKTFGSEMAKFVYICAIVEHNINDVYMRLQKAEQSKEKMTVADTSVLYHEGADYITKTEKGKTNLENLW